MGNKTNIEIEKYFVDTNYKEEIIEKVIKLIIKLKEPASGTKCNNLEKFYLYLYCDKDKESSYLRLSRLPNSEIETKYSFITYEWTPVSHMRDFEVIDRFTKKEVKVARGQGIGVFISDVHKSYIKIIYDKNTELGIKKVTFSLWNHSKEAKELLNNDLSIGYNVLIYNKEFNNLVEKIDKRDNQKTVIVFNNLKKYAEYEHKKRKRKDEDDDNEPQKKKKKIG